MGTRKIKFDNFLKRSNFCFFFLFKHERFDKIVHKKGKKDVHEHL